MTTDQIDNAWTAYKATYFGPPQALRKREFIAGWEAAQRGRELSAGGPDYWCHVHNAGLEGCMCEPRQPAPELSREEANRVHAFGLDVEEEACPLYGDKPWTQGAAE